MKTENVEQAAVRDNTPSKFPVMTFDKKVHDFGTIMDGEAQETVFSYTNTGEAPLVITEIKSTCGCPVPQIGVEHLYCLVNHLNLLLNLTEKA